jgi:hypothetical protein
MGSLYNKEELSREKYMSNKSERYKIHANKNPAPWAGFLFRKNIELHGRHKIGDHRRSMILQQARHASCHSGVH